MAQGLPLHIAQLIDELTYEDTEPALLKRKPLLQCDISLRKAFTSLGFTPETGTFQREISAKEAIEAIKEACEEGARERAREQGEIAVDLSVSPGFEVSWGKPCSTPLFPKADVESLPSFTPLLEHSDYPLSALWSPSLSPLPKPSISSFSPYLRTPTTKPSSLSSLSPDGPLLRSNRGLKTLSGKVYYLLRHIGLCTYKEVADQLLTENVWSVDRALEEKNVRRRVYDAINVLVAANMLKKVGKTVKIAHISHVKNALDLRIAAKTAALTKLIEQYRGLKAILSRNQTLSCDFRWYPPFWIVTSDPAKAVTIHTKRGELKVKSAKRLNILGEELLSQVICSPIEPVRGVSDLEVRCAQMLACSL
jgi:hypothetical protein